MDCADRIAVLTTERTLEPVRGLARPDAPGGVTVRALVATCRLDVTIHKLRPRDSDRSPAYGWEVHELEADGASKPDGLDLHSPPSAGDADPEDAYWSALEAARAAVDSIRGHARQA
ncbi:MAG: hypothetical protein H0U12_08500 [Thermoleophilaceae bacterium]|nr:hypothetical protein [Thermoleophilaceae bacterium]